MRKYRSILFLALTVTSIFSSAVQSKPTEEKVLQYAEALEISPFISQTISNEPAYTDHYEALGEVALFITSSPQPFFQELYRQKDAFKYTQERTCLSFLMAIPFLGARSSIRARLLTDTLDRLGLARPEKKTLEELTALFEIAFPLPPAQKYSSREHHNRFVKEVEAVAARTYSRYAKAMLDAILDGDRFPILIASRDEATKFRNLSQRSNLSLPLYRSALRLYVHAYMNAGFRIHYTWQSRDLYYNEPEALTQRIQEQLEKMGIRSAKLREVMTEAYLSAQAAAYGIRSDEESRTQDVRKTLFLAIRSEVIGFHEQILSRDALLASLEPKQAPPIITNAIPAKGSKSLPKRPRTLVSETPLSPEEASEQETGFTLVFSNQAREQIEGVKRDSRKWLSGQVNATLEQLKKDPAYPGLASHRIGFTDRQWLGHFTSYVNNNRPDAYRIIWRYSEKRGEILVQAVIPHY